MNQKKIKISGLLSGSVVYNQATGRTILCQDLKLLKYN
jgi:hypothetical protein